MKISLFVRKGGWHTNQLRGEAKNRKVQLEIIKLNDLNNLQERLSSLGDVIIWNSIPQSTVEKRTLFFNLLKNKPAINPAYQLHPFVMRKLFQQRYVERHTSLNHIHTFFFNDKRELKNAIPKFLRFPIIQKPNFGSQGDDITIINSFSDINSRTIDFGKYIFQNFIRNSGDYRVLVLGGKALGIIKRTAKKGSFLNNVSKGGTAEKISDPELSEILSKIALEIASIFNLSFCGVDIIFNEDDGKYYFLELNANPQWRGFQAATSVNVAREIIDFCLSLGSRKKKPTFQLIEDYYEKNYESLGKHQFHYSSRMYLWTKKSIYKKRLARQKNNYLGLKSSGTTKTIKDILGKKYGLEDLVRKDLRKLYLKKYPSIIQLNNVLAKVLFAETIYREDLRPAARKILKLEKLLKIKDGLENDREAIAALSTIAVNFFYYLSYYLRQEKIADPKLFLDVAKKDFAVKLRGCHDLRIYLLTHSIIGESRFYSRKITRHKQIYLSMLSLLENIIRDNYFAVPLENKFEFLVCSRLCGYNPAIEKMILSEADRSLADIGNFLVGRLNDTKGFLSQNIQDAEHRNVLYLMACNPSKLFCK